MSTEISSYGAFLRLVMGGSVLLLAKNQIQSVEVVRDDTVKISNGAGPFSEILVKLAEVTLPSALPDVAALRDAIARMLDNANQYEVDALVKDKEQLDELIAIKQLFNLLNGSMQVELNFLQLIVNGVLAISNRLLEERELTMRMLDNQEEQTDQLKEQVALQEQAKNSLLNISGQMDEVKALTESSNTIQTNMGVKLDGISVNSAENLINTSIIAGATQDTVNEVNRLSLGLYERLNDLQVVASTDSAVLSNMLTLVSSINGVAQTIPPHQGYVLSRLDGINNLLMGHSSENAQKLDAVNTNLVTILDRVNTGFDSIVSQQDTMISLLQQLNAA